jgi:hypothetical protein
MLITPLLSTANSNKRYIIKDRERERERERRVAGIQKHYSDIRLPHTSVVIN